MNLEKIMQDIIKSYLSITTVRRLKLSIHHFIDMFLVIIYAYLQLISSWVPSILMFNTIEAFSSTCMSTAYR